MKRFTDAEIAYLKSQPLGRLATIGTNGKPHVAPVGIFYDPENQTIVIGGLDMAASKKYRDAEQDQNVAVVIDDLAAIDPWTPRGIEIRGRAETHRTGGGAIGIRIGASFPFSEAWISIRPQRILAWGIDSDSFELSSRNIS